MIQKNIQTRHARNDFRKGEGKLTKDLARRMPRKVIAIWRKSPLGNTVVLWWAPNRLYFAHNQHHLLNAQTYET